VSEKEVSAPIAAEISSEQSVDRSTDKGIEDIEALRADLHRLFASRQKNVARKRQLAAQTESTARRNIKNRVHGK